MRMPLMVGGRRDRARSRARRQPSRTWPRPRSGSTTSSSPPSSASTSRRPRCSGSSTPPRRSPAWRSTCCRRASRRTPTSSTVLTKAFEEITGIKVNHQILGEGEVVQAVQTQMQTNRNLYDAYVNDSDLIGTHSRMQQAYNLTEQMAGRLGRRDLADARPRRLHGQELHHRPGRQPLPAARPAVRQPLLVPQGLVRQPRLPGRASRRSTATTSACRSTGRPTRTSPSSSPTT